MVSGFEGFEGFDGMLNHPPDHELLTFFEGDIGKGGVTCFELDLSVAFVELFDGDLPIDYRRHDTAMLGFQSAIHNQQISIEYPEGNHGLTPDHQQEGSRWVGNKLSRQVYTFLTQIFSRRWKACCDLLDKLCQPQGYRVDSEDLIG